MKKIVNILLLLVFISVVTVIAITELTKQKRIPDFLLGEVKIDNIQVERRMNGKILPSEEINVKSKINGIIEEVFVEVGQKVQDGDKIATVRNLTEPIDIENLKSNVILLEIQLAQAEANYLREKELLTDGLSAKVDYENVEARYHQLIEQVESAQKRLLMATSGVITTNRELSNIVYAPSSGTILSLLSRPGTPVIRQNNFNEGTTMATIADMSTLRFYGKITERDLGKIVQGQAIEVETMSLKGERLVGVVEKIHPKGSEENGIVRFSIEASFDYSGITLWGGVNATAIAVLEQKDSVLCLEEKYIIYENDSSYVLRKGIGDDYLKTGVTIGLSDGMKTEIIAGLVPSDKVKLPNED